MKMKKADLLKEYNKLVNEKTNLEFQVNQLKKNHDDNYQLKNDHKCLKEEFQKIKLERDNLLDIIHSNPDQKKYLELKEERDVLYDIFKIVRSNMSELCDYKIDDEPKDLLKTLDIEFNDMINEKYRMRDKYEKLEGKLESIRRSVKGCDYDD
jgi:hypothetical protein